MYNLRPNKDFMELELMNIMDGRDSGLVLPDSAKEDLHNHESAVFKVLSVGEGDEDFEYCLPVEVGDVVMMEGASVGKITFDGKVRYIGRARDIAFFIEEEKEYGKNQGFKN